MSNETRQARRIDKAFAAIALKATPADVFVLYIAGHGKTVDARYYFVPEDFRFDGDSAEMIDKAIVAHGVSQDQWQAWLARIAARRSLLLLDTCEAGTLTGDSTQALEQEAQRPYGAGHRPQHLDRVG